MSLEGEASAWRREEDERDVADAFRAHRTDERRRVVEEAYEERDGDGDGFEPIDIRGAKKISRAIWRVLDVGMSRLSPKMKLQPDEFAELVDDTAPVVQLYVPQPGGPGFNPWWALGFTVATVYGSKLFASSDKEKKPTPASEQTVDGHVANGKPKEPPRATA